MGQKFQIIAIVLFFLVTGIISVHASEPGYTIEKNARFTLYPGKKNDPYSMIIPLRLKHYGKIRVSLSKLQFSGKKVKFISFPPKGAIRLWLVNPKVINKHNVPSKYIYKEKFIMDPTRDYLEYYIDEPELIRNHGKYDLYISNMTKNTVTGAYHLQYPGSMQESRESREQARAQLPDLSIEDIDLTPSNNLRVTIVNKGKSGLPYAAWSKKYHSTTMLKVYRNGKAIGGASLDRIDPDKHLRQPGGKVIYISNIKINQTSEINVGINPNLIKEVTFKNNALLKVLSPHHKTQKLPDLIISKVFLTPQKKVGITIRNIGQSGIPEACWKATGAKACSLKLEINGKSWGGATLKIIDRSKRLKYPGGTVNYISNYTVNRPTRISATIDSLSVVKEKNERNNSYSTELRP